MLLLAPGAHASGSEEAQAKAAADIITTCLELFQPLTRAEQASFHAQLEDTSLVFDNPHNSKLALEKLDIVPLETEDLQAFSEAIFMVGTSSLGSIYFLQNEAPALPYSNPEVKALLIDTVLIDLANSMARHDAPNSLASLVPELGAPFPAYWAADAVPFAVGDLGMGSIASCHLTAPSHELIFQALGIDDEADWNRLEQRDTWQTSLGWPFMKHTEISIARLYPEFAAEHNVLPMQIVIRGLY